MEAPKNRCKKNLRKLGAPGERGRPMRPAEAPAFLFTQAALYLHVCRVYIDLLARYAEFCMFLFCTHPPPLLNFPLTCLFYVF